MKRKIISWLMVLTILSPAPCLASGQEKKDAAALNKIKHRVEEAYDKNSRATIKLKSGETIKGKVAELTAQGFTIKGKSASGADFITTIDYASVAAVKGQSKWFRTFKNIGEYSLIGTVGVFVFLPIYGLAFLISGGDLPSC